jgi:superfamily I DNA/RNA helicase
MTTETILEGLNESQARVVTTLSGSLLVVAGPGTGKTLTMVRRIAYLIKQGVRPEHILAMTFTNRAAREMQERAASLLGDQIERIFVGTFHLLGLRILREIRGDDFGICSRDEQVELLRPLLKGSAKKAPQMAEAISRVKNFLQKPDEETREILVLYQAALQQRSLYDFDDLIRIPIALLESNHEKRDYYQKKFSHVIVDEYQDINPAQYRLLMLLARNARTVCAVGDCDQAIYGFRGADLSNFLNFEKAYPCATKITLTQNYRSTGVILSAADSVIRENMKRFDKKLTCSREKGMHISVISVPDERTEGAAIIQEIEERIGGTSHYRMMHASAGMGHFDRSFKFSDFAVIFRTNAQAKALEEEFSASGIPYQLIGRKSSMQEKETEQTLAYLRSLLPAVDPSGTMPSDAKEAKLLETADLFDPRADVVTLMTLHMAKGLEFPVVFITGCEDGLIPCTVMLDDVDIEEERRLYYVGMTRAKDELLILHSRRRYLYGQRLSPVPSPFLADIPGSLVKCMVVPNKVKKHKALDRQLGLF